MNKKRWLSVFMAVLMVISLLPAVVWAAAPSGSLGGKLKIKGDSYVGSTLSANYKKVTPEGMTDEYVSFEWSRKNGSELTQVGTDKTYTITGDDLGCEIVLKISGKEDMGVSGELTATSNPAAATEDEAQTDSQEDDMPSEEIPDSYSEEQQNEEAPAQETEDEEYQIPEAQDDENAYTVQDTENNGSSEEILEINPQTEEETLYEIPEYKEENPEAPAEERDDSLDEAVSQIPEATEDGTMENPDGEAQGDDSKEPAEAAYTISADTGVLDFDSLTEGYTSTVSKELILSNIGANTVTLMVSSSQYFDVSYAMPEGAEQWDTITLEKDQSAKFLISPKQGLEAGNYSDTITFAIAEDASVALQVQGNVQVEEAAQGLKAEPDTLNFGSAEEGYETAPEAQSVTVTNNGTTVMTLTAPSAENFIVDNFADVQLAPGESTAFTLQPKTGLPAGDYVETITIYPELASVTANFQVKEKQVVYDLAADPAELDFGEAEEGYDTPKGQKVTVTNNGTGAVTLEQPVCQFFEVEELPTLQLEAEESTAFTVWPAEGLEEGDYYEILEIGNDAGISLAVDLSFSVNSKHIIVDDVIKLTGIHKAADVKGVKTGTKKTAEALGLPSKVVIETTEGKKKATVKWNVKGCPYDPSATQPQNFAVKGTVVLPEGVENPDNISLITSVKVSVDGYTPKTADPARNRIDGISSNGKYTTETKITITAVGAGMDNTNPRKGDTRYLPLNWKVLETRIWENAPYSATFRMGQSGDYTLTVTFNQQSYNGSEWENTGRQSAKQINFHVSQAAGQNITPAATKAPSNSQRKAVATGDNTPIAPFVIILVIAAVCIVGVVVFRKKKK